MFCTAARIVKAARKPGPQVRSFSGMICRGLRFVVLAGLILTADAAAGLVRAAPVKGEATLTEQGGYARLVLKFQDEVATDIVVAGSILVIRFKTPVDIPVDLLADSLPAYIGSVRRDPDGSAIRLALTQKVRINTMTAGERVFIDLLSEKWTGLPPPLPAEVVKELSERALAAERALRMQKQADEAKKRQPVRVRASIQPTFVRFVFEVPDGVNVSSSLNVDKFSLLFTAALSFDLADVKIAMPANIQSVDQKIEGDTSRVDISLIGEADVHAFREEKNYIVDVGFEQAQKPAQANASPASKAASAPDAPARENALAGPEIMLPTSEQIAREMGEIKPQVAEPVAKPADAIPAEAAPDVKPRAEAAKPDLAPQPVPVAPPVVKADAPAAAAAPLPKEVPPVQASAAAPPALVPEIKHTSDAFRLIFSFASPTPAAVFRRSDSIWLVFDTDKAIDTDAIRRDGSFAIASVMSIDLAKGRAIRIKLNRPQLATLSGNALAWTLVLADKAQSTQQPLTAVRNMAEPGHGSVSVTFAKPGQIHRFSDPDAGDSLMVVTAGAPVQGFLKRQDFVEFSLLESIHGIVVQQNADDLTASVSSDTLTLTRPGGLTLSTATTAPERAATTVRPVFDVTDWRDFQNSDFMSMRNKLMTAAAQATGAARMPAHIDIARFYLARRMYPEAKGILDLAFLNVKSGEEDASALTVHAVACALSGRPELALADLANSAVAANVDSQLWKALAYARQEKWPEAREKFKNVEFVITALPLDMQRIVLADAFRAALEVKDYTGAASRSNDLAVIGLDPGQEASIGVLRGRLAEALGRDKDAWSEYQAAAASADRPSAAEAQLRILALRQQREDISEDDALRELEALSVMWRGDSIEVKTLEMLSRLYAIKGRYFESFGAVRVATTLQPNSVISRKMQDEASALFEQLYNGEKGDELPPVDALAMFYEYRDLTPIGRRGDEMIRRLADRLVAVDLLDQASELLQYQIDHRLEGAARAQVASRLAMVYLMSRKPERAITALRSTRIGDLAGELRQQRLLLEARAQTDIGRHDLALDIISNIGGREAIRLRSDIYWAARRWRESAEQIELLYGDRWRDFRPLSAIEKSDIIRAAIGYALAEDAIGLARFREKYTAKMEGGSDRAAFDVASKPATANSADFARIAKMAATIDTLDGFLREMKTRFPDAIARAKLPPEIKADPNPTGTLPEIKGLKPARVVY